MLVFFIVFSTQSYKQNTLLDLTLTWLITGLGKICSHSSLQLLASLVLIPLPTTLLPMVGITRPEMDTTMFQSNVQCYNKPGWKQSTTEFNNSGTWYYLTFCNSTVSTTKCIVLFYLLSLPIRHWDMWQMVPKLSEFVAASTCVTSLEFVTTQVPQYLPF